MSPLRNSLIHPTYEVLLSNREHKWYRLSENKYTVKFGFVTLNRLPVLEFFPVWGNCQMENRSTVLNPDK